MHHRLHRRFSALAVGMLLLGAPVLASCGFDYATDRISTISAGVNDREGEIDVLGAVVIADRPDLGVFATTLVDNDLATQDSLTGLTGDLAGEITLLDGELAAVPIDDQGRVSLFRSGGIDVSGGFEPGDFVTVTLSFSNGQESTLDVPVVAPCDQYSPEALPEIVLPAGDETAQDDAFVCTSEREESGEKAEG